ncbi:MAG TPA: DUF1846 domain-containing protein [Candidatus Fimenecus excrementigallinarum]|uniref:DUF1846 domain-containing protein n=1 Tax=Candidatus Fimenecus excrementigallinarum TaxID=2840816 RepID=A0A9D1IFB5_9FIRM|nr:DUF1846 domain-containing protein [Candidatus Fimenecus excrementigallinarum]
MKIGFDNDKYLKMQSAHIRERIDSFGGKLYLEFGGKLFDDYHASRVLPGFLPDSKLKMLLELREDMEIIIAINANDIEKSKVRGDIGITYEQDILRLMDVYASLGLSVCGVVMTQYAAQPSAAAFEKRLQKLGVRVFRHYPIEGYPANIPLIVSDDGFGKNDFIDTSRSLVVVTAPGPGSGKMAVCLSQLYHEHRRGVRAGYAKFETFPVWNLPLKHPVNLAYEAATTDLNDVNMIDPFHLEAYGKTAVNYNRDIEIFPVLNTIFERIFGVSPYKSPTDMGVNMAGCCIIDDDVVCEASKQEVIRRYYKALVAAKKGENVSQEILSLDLLLKQLDITPTYRRCVRPALDVAERTGEPAAAMELPDGRIVTGKTSALLGAASAVLLNALKALAGINPEIDLISPVVIEPIQDLKVNHLGSKNPRLHTDEVLLALSISAATSPTAEHAMQALESLRGCDMHSTVILSDADMNTCAKLGVQVTSEPMRQTKALYYK